MSERTPSLMKTYKDLLLAGVQVKLIRLRDGTMFISPLTGDEPKAPISNLDQEAIEADRAFNGAFGQGLQAPQ